jgi:hypothetical protein
VCVCPVLRAFILGVNDSLPDAMRQEYLGPLPWVIIGTKVNDPKVSRLRAKYMLKCTHKLTLRGCGTYFHTEMLNARKHTANATEYCRTGFWLVAANACSSALACFIRAFDANPYELRLLAVGCRDIIVGAAAIGSKTPVELVMTPDQLCEALK